MAHGHTSRLECRRNAAPLRNGGARQRRAEPALTSTYALELFPSLNFESKVDAHVSYRGLRTADILTCLKYLAGRQQSELRLVIATSKPVLTTKELRCAVLTSESSTGCVKPRMTRLHTSKSGRNFHPILSLSCSSQLTTHHGVIPLFLLFQSPQRSSQSVSTIRATSTDSRCQPKLLKLRNREVRHFYWGQSV